MKDRFDKSTLKSATYCTFCPKMCRFACPAAEFSGDEAFVPSVKVGALWEYSRERGDFGVARYSFTGCFFCLECREYCYHEIDVPSLMAIGRSIVHAYQPYEKTIEIRKNIETSGNMFGDQLAWNDLSFSRVIEKEVVIFPGCHVLKYEKEMLEKAFAVLERSNVNFAGLPEEAVPACCGYPLHALGDIEGFKEHAAKVVQSLKTVATLVTLCPHCAYTFKNIYSSVGVKVPFEVLTHVEYLSQAIRFVPERILHDPFIYHDPCYLGRHMGLYSEARQLVWKAVDDVAEFLHSRGDADCCGAGGMVPYINESLADAVTEARLKDVDERYEIIAPCPHCRLRFRDKGRVALDIFDIFERAIR